MSGGVVAGKKMAKEMREMQMGWAEVAPTHLIKPRRSSTSPKLATIFEEAERNMEATIVIPKRSVIYFVPFLVSVASYLLWLRNFGLSPAMSQSFDLL